MQITKGGEKSSQPTELAQLLEIGEIMTKLHRMSVEEKDKVIDTLMRQEDF